MTASTSQPPDPSGLPLPADAALWAHAPFITDVIIKTEPRADFGRFFLRAEQMLHEVGITARLVSPEALVAINAANRDSWAPLISVIDHREFPTRDDEMSCLVGFDADGRAVATSVVRRFDFTGTTVGEELRSLRMLFGARAPAMAETVSFELTAPSADRIGGQILYHGGVWVHPQCRKLGLTRIMPKLNRYFALSQQHYDFEIAMASAALLKPHVGASYSVEGSELHYAYKLNGSTLWDGVFNWSSRAWIIETLRRDLTAMATTSPLNYVSGDQQMRVAGTGKR